MNLSDCKTIEEYRNAAHYWQQRWSKCDDVLILIEQDYNHPWPNETTKDEQHRTYILSKIKSLFVNRT